VAGTVALLHPKEAAMIHETTMEYRRSELAGLLDAIAKHPERDWSEERKRIAVLREMLARRETARGHA
jgi:hypothetical protein